MVAGAAAAAMDAAYPKLSPFLVIFLCFLCGCSHLCAAATVTYDHRALVIDGTRRVLISGSIHYPRSTPEVPLLSFSLSLSDAYLLLHLCFD